MGREEIERWAWFRVKIKLSTPPSFTTSHCLDFFKKTHWRKVISFRCEEASAAGTPAAPRDQASWSRKNPASVKRQHGTPPVNNDGYEPADCVCTKEEGATRLYRDGIERAIDRHRADNRLHPDDWGNVSSQEASALGHRPATQTERHRRSTGGPLRDASPGVGRAPEESGGLDRKGTTRPDIEKAPRWRGRNFH